MDHRALMVQGEVKVPQDGKETRGTSGLVGSPVQLVSLENEGFRVLKACRVQQGLLEKTATLGFLVRLEILDQRGRRVQWDL